MVCYFKQSYSLHDTDQHRRSIFWLFLRLIVYRNKLIYTHDIENSFFPFWERIMGQIQRAYAWGVHEDRGCMEFESSHVRFWSPVRGESWGSHDVTAKIHVLGSMPSAWTHRAASDSPCASPAAPRGDLELCTQNMSSNWSGSTASSACPMEQVCS